MLIGSKMTERQLEDYLELIRKWYWVSYLFIPIMLLLRISFAWLCLKVGSFITESFNDSSFWKICIQAEIVFAVGSVTSLLYTELFIDVETLEQLSVNPFSLQVFASSSMPKWCAYFFNTLNIFEVCYVAFLAYLISEESKKTFMSTLKFVTTSYLPALMLWVLFVSYFSLIFQP
jgi:hypothetical protein